MKRKLQLTGIRNRYLLISVQHVYGYGILDKTLDAFLCTLQWCLLCELVSNEAFKNHDSGDDFCLYAEADVVKLKNDWLI